MDITWSSSDIEGSSYAPDSSVNHLTWTIHGSTSFANYLPRKLVCRIQSAPAPQNMNHNAQLCV
jgi:hypothetical protein